MFSVGFSRTAGNVKRFASAVGRERPGQGDEEDNDWEYLLSQNFPATCVYFRSAWGVADSERNREDNLGRNP